MKIKAIKKEMENYKDFLGGELLGIGNINNASTKKELAKIIDEHSTHLENILLDAESHLSEFRSKVGLVVF